MDTWSEKQLKLMQLGGNQKFQDFCEAHGIQNMPINTKYKTKAAEFYRLDLAAQYDGSERPAELPPGTGKDPIYEPPPKPSGTASMQSPPPTPPQETEGWGIWSVASMARQASAKFAQGAAEAMDANPYTKAVKDGTANAASSAYTATSSVAATAYDASSKAATQAYSATSNVAAKTYTASTSAATATYNASANAASATYNASTNAVTKTKELAGSAPGSEVAGRVWTHSTSSIGAMASYATSSVASTKAWMIGEDTGQANITEAAEEQPKPKSVLE